MSAVLKWGYKFGKVVKWHDQGLSASSTSKWTSSLRNFFTVEQVCIMTVSAHCNYYCYWYCMCICMSLIFCSVFPTKIVYVFLVSLCKWDSFPTCPKKTLCISYDNYTYCIVFGLKLVFISTKGKCSDWVHFPIRSACRREKNSQWKAVKPHCFWLKCTAVAENQYKESHCLSAYVEVLQNIYQIDVFWSGCSVICTVRSTIVVLQVETSFVAKRIS